MNIFLVKTGINKKIIIKIGTYAIFDAKKEILKKNIIKNITKNISYLLKNEHEIILVSSGAVGCAKKIISGKNDLGLKQARSAIGQALLMKTYIKYFSKYKIPVAQFLITNKDLQEKEGKENIKNTYEHLKKKAIVIVNENDVTSIEELKIGDNDTLASELLLALDFDKLIILTEIGALIKNNIPILNSNFYHVKDYDNLNISNKGFGGLQAKLNTAKKITQNKKECIIAKAEDNIIKILQNKAPSTTFKYREELK